MADLAPDRPLERPEQSRRQPLRLQFELDTDLRASWYRLEREDGIDAYAASKRPADDEAREQVQKSGQVQLATLADHELGGVADACSKRVNNRWTGMIGRDQQ